MIIKDSGFEVECLAASRSPHNPDDTVLTIRARYPRIILAELNTHRHLSRGSSSSRAIPIEKMLASIEKDPAMPVRFGGNQAGMQDKGEEHTDSVAIPRVLWGAFDYWETHVYPAYSRGMLVSPRVFWNFMSWVNSQASRSYSDAGYHKQIANRLTEPYQWMQTVISATTQGWIDFLKLRDHEAADPTIAKLAGLIRKLRESIEYVQLQLGEWHLPYILEEEKSLSLQKKLVYSTARCARVSYEPFDGEPSWDKELKRHNLLVTSEPPHASPTEHPCTPMPGRWGNFVGFCQYRQVLEGKINGNSILDN